MDWFPSFACTPKPSKVGNSEQIQANTFLLLVVGCLSRILQLFLVKKAHWVGHQSKTYAWSTPSQRKEGVDLRVGQHTHYCKLHVIYRNLPYGRNLTSTPGTSLLHRQSRLHHMCSMLLPYMGPWLTSQPSNGHFQTPYLLGKESWAAQPLASTWVCKCIVNFT